MLYFRGGLNKKDLYFCYFHALNIYYLLANSGALEISGETLQ